MAHRMAAITNSNVYAFFGEV